MMSVAPTRIRKDSARILMVGATLIIEGFDVHVPKGYIYFAMAFSVVVEMINIRMRKKSDEVLKLHKKL